MNIFLDMLGTYYYTNQDLGECESESRKSVMFFEIYYFCGYIRLHHSNYQHIKYNEEKQKKSQPNYLNFLNNHLILN